MSRVSVQSTDWALDPNRCGLLQYPEDIFDLLETAGMKWFWTLLLDVGLLDERDLVPLLSR